MTTDVLAGFTELETVRNGKSTAPAGVFISYGGQCRFNKAFTALLDSPRTVTVLINWPERRFAFRFGIEGARGLRADRSGGLSFNSARLSHKVLNRRLVTGLFPFIEQREDAFVFSMEPVPGTARSAIRSPMRHKDEAAD